MQISNEQFTQAGVVIDAGCLAADMCHMAGFSDQVTVDLLREGMLDEANGDRALDTANPRILADLLAICIIRLAKQNRDLLEVGQKVEHLMALAKEKGLTTDD